MCPAGKLNDETLLGQLARAEVNYRLLHQHQVRAINVMGTIGCGKTALIERIIARVAPCGVRVAVIAGDPVAEEDQHRFLAHHIVSVPLITDGAPYLDAQGVNHALQFLPLDEIDLLFIENVGSLFGPVDYPLGTDFDLVVVSAAQGEEVARKHPWIFSQTELLVINKIDLAAAAGVEIQHLVADFSRLNPHGRVIRTDALHHQGIEDLLTALEISCAGSEW